MKGGGRDVAVSVQSWILRSIQKRTSDSTSCDSAWRLAEFDAALAAMYMKKRKREVRSPSVVSVANLVDCRVTLGLL